MPRCAADPAAYAQCTVGPCRLPILGPRPGRTDIVGSIFPGPASGSNLSEFQRLFDGQTWTDGSGMGGGMQTTASSNAPFVTIDLGRTVTDFAGVGLWAWTNAQSNLAFARNLTVLVHTTANFTTDPGPTQCASGVRAMSHYDTFVPCPAVAGGVRYGECSCCLRVAVRVLTSHIHAWYCRNVQLCGHPTCLHSGPLWTTPPSCTHG